MADVDLSPNRVSPVIDYTSLDFDSINADLESWARARFADRWTDFNASQLGVVMKEMVAYLGDQLFFQVNSTIREAFGASAVRLANFANFARAFGYEVPDASQASVTLRLTLDNTGVFPIEISLNDQFANQSSSDPVYYQPRTAESISLADATTAGFVWDIEAIEGERYENVLVGVSDGNQNQRYLLPATFIIRNTVEVTVGGASWTTVSNFAESTASSTECRVMSQDDGSCYLVFGDGQFGAVPAGAAEIRATFYTGGGTRGNLAAGSIETIVQADAGVLGITNPASASGGAAMPTLKEARLGFIASLVTLERAVTIEDYALLAAQVSGVSQAMARDSSTSVNVVRLWLAPAGGGAPTDTLKNNVSLYLKDKKWIGKTVQLLDPVYRNIQFRFLLHVNNRFRAADVEEAFRKTIINGNGTGIFDFAQLGFAGRDSDGALVMTDDNMKAAFAPLRRLGLDRVEVQWAFPAPMARARETGNVGNFTVSATIQSAAMKRRQYYVLFTSATDFRVYIRLVGTVTSITASTLTDEEGDLAFDGVNITNDWLLCPDRRNTTTVKLDSSSSGTDFITQAGEASFFTLTETGREYFAYDSNYTTGTVGATHNTADGLMAISVTAGSTPAQANDAFVVDAYPLVSDFKLSYDEYPAVTDLTLETYTSGGAKVLCLPHPSEFRTSAPSRIPTASAST